MKKLRILMLCLLITITTFKLDSFAAEKEMRAAWISTVHNIDWPKTKNNVEQQKKEYIDLIDKLQDAGINTLVVQVRPAGDAIYNSSINPWSAYLTGTQGKNPGYDPLQFMIEEAHKRGMELHAWFNPFRITTSGNDMSKLAQNNQAILHPEWVIKTSKYLMFNPGLPEVRKYIVDTVSEVVKNYDIDGVHFDDYFYNGDTDEDDEAYAKYGQGMTKGDWRRSNVNTLLRDVKSAIKSIDQSIEFGVSPIGIWKNKSSDPTGSDTKGNQSYYSQYADTRYWIQQNLVDYITPQVYWEIGNPVADYSKLVSWWSNEVKNTNVDLYIGQGIYKQGSGSYPNENVAGQIKEQIALNRKYPEIKGSMFFSARDIVNNSQIHADLKSIYVEETATEKPVEPGNSVNTKSLKGNLRYDTAVAISKEGWPSTSDTVVLVSGNSVVDGVTATPLATTNNAPILLVDKNSVPQATKNELIRLNPSKIILVGGTSVIGENVISDIKTVLPKTSITRLGGIDRYETSLLVAKQISLTNTINTVYIASGIGEPDALSIASKAGEEKQPIILAGKDNVSDNIYNWIKSKNVKNAYFIGGTSVLSNNVINRINTVTVDNVANNRISGSTRQETNAKVIEKFYTNSSYDSVIVTKADPLVDALAAGPLAAKKKSPIVIVGNSVSETQNKVLDSKSTSLLYEVGGGINQSSFNTIKDLLR